MDIKLEKPNDNEDDDGFLNDYNRFEIVLDIGVSFSKTVTITSYFSNVMK